MMSLLFAILVSSPALAAIPGAPPAGTRVYTNPNIRPKTYSRQDAAWIYKKTHFQIRRLGVTLPNGCPSLTAPAICTPPASLLLPYATVAATLEPSGNPRTYWPVNNPNLATLQRLYGGNYDDAQVMYMYTNYNMYLLCAAGALTNALFYWNAPVTSNGKHAFTDLSVANNPSQASTWGATKVTTWGDISYNDIYDGGNENINPHANRSYMMYIAWLSNPGGEWPANYTGVLDSAHYPTQGAWLQWMQDVLNWEASGHNSSAWSNFFYTVNWHYHQNPDGTWSGGQQADLLNDVESDLYYNHVPVVAEVNAEMMPNWPHSGGRVNHAITIIGYDNNLGKYYYTDTCGSANGRGTGCGANSQQQLYSVPQSRMWQAIDNVPYNPSTGDGGWIW